MFIHYPDTLPISAHADLIRTTLQEQRVVIVCGDTGSGKTTQLPKIALQASAGQRGMVACTQPRRLAAMAMAQRLAEECRVSFGQAVGFQHRFAKQFSDETIVKFMTDGILLTEVARDRQLRAYHTIIIDEAHERSLNTDFLLGLLKQVLTKRRDLRLIISSATLDASQFAAFFDNAPVISVPGRLHPIETRWRPALDEDPDLSQQVADACGELIDEGEGDILVFLPGERDIRDAAETLRGRQLGAVEVIPLLASLPSGEQQRAFQTSSLRRIILSTNVAETSLTIPGIRYVVDSGLARLSRYNARTHVQRLQVEAISQASAAQRQGRCGRIAPGICIRLYAQDDFRKRAPYTPPEILRSNLARVILTMFDLRLGAIEEFPLIDRPSKTSIREGYRELEMLGAFKATNEGALPAYQLSGLGRQLARLPLNPALARILLSAHREQALADALIIIAALECDDPRRRPIEKQDEADARHARLLSPNSDFASLLRLWRWYHEATEDASEAVARRFCKESFLSYPRMRDWIHLRDQLAQLCRQLKFDPQSNRGGEVGLHRALVSGLLYNLGRREPEGDAYRGTRGLSFYIFPGSGLMKSKERQREQRLARRSQASSKTAPTLLTHSRDWVLAAELVETTRLFARTVACIDPAWIEPQAKHLCKYSYYAPEWDAQQGFVRVNERVTLLGLTLAEARRRDYSRINPMVARVIFIRMGLVAGEFPAPMPKFLKQNLARTRQLQENEARLRQPGTLFDPEVVFDFYARRLPEAICNAHALRRWLSSNHAAQAHLEKQLTLQDVDLPPLRDLSLEFPLVWSLSGNSLPLSYCYDPGAAEDGISCRVPLSLLGLLKNGHSDWLVPGVLDEKIRWMLSLLPMKSRRLLVPLDETLARLKHTLVPGSAPLAKALSTALYATRQLKVDPAIWAEEQLPAHLRMRFVVVDAKGRELGAGRELPTLLEQYQPSTPVVSPQAPQHAQWHREHVTAWDFGDLPECVDIGRPGWPILNYPALVDAGASVSLRLFAEQDKAQAAHERGLCRLYALTLGKEWRGYMQAPALSRTALVYVRQLGIEPGALGAELGLTTLRDVLLADEPLIRAAQTFQARLTTRRGALHKAYLQRARLVASVLQDAQALETQLGRLPVSEATVSDLSEQLAWLIFPGFVTATPWQQLQEFPRYLEACRLRLQRAMDNPQGEARKIAELAPHWQKYRDLVTQPKPPLYDRVLAHAYRWQVEEFRVSLFAQELRTPTPVSSKRLTQLWQAFMH